MLHAYNKVKTINEANKLYGLLSSELQINTGYKKRAIRASRTHVWNILNHVKYIDRLLESTNTNSILNQLDYLTRSEYLLVANYAEETMLRVSSYHKTGETV